MILLGVLKYLSSLIVTVLDPESVAWSCQQCEQVEKPAV